MAHLVEGKFLERRQLCKKKKKKTMTEEVR